MKHLILTSFLLLAACTNTPTVISFNEKSVGIYNPAASCVGLLLNQDCSKLTGATRHIEIDTIELRIAGSADGRVLLVMSKPTLTPDETALTDGVAAIKKFLLRKAIRPVATKLIYGDNTILGYHYTFDIEVYSHLKMLTARSKVY